MSYTAKDLTPLVRGDDWSIKLTITENGSVVNITGYTYWLTLKSDIDSVDPGQLQISTVASGANATNGIVYINVPHASTTSLLKHTIMMFSRPTHLPQQLLRLFYLEKLR